MIVKMVDWNVKPSSLSTESHLSSTTKSGYDFKDGILIETTTDPLENNTVASHDLRVTSTQFFIGLSLWVKQKHSNLICWGGSHAHPLARASEIGYQSKRRLSKHHKGGRVPWSYYADYI